MLSEISLASFAHVGIPLVKRIHYLPETRIANVLSVRMERVKKPNHLWTGILLLSNSCSEFPGKKQTLTVTSKTKQYLIPPGESRAVQPALAAKIIQNYVSHSEESKDNSLLWSQATSGTMTYTNSWHCQSTAGSAFTLLCYWCQM